MTDQAPAVIPVVSADPRTPRAASFLRQWLIPALAGGCSTWLMMDPYGKTFLMILVLFAAALAAEPLLTRLGPAPAGRAGRRRLNRALVFLGAALLGYLGLYFWGLLFMLRALS